MGQVKQKILTNVRLFCFFKRLATPEFALLRLFLEFAFDHTTTLDGDALEAHFAINDSAATNGQIAAIQEPAKLPFTFMVSQVTLPSNTPVTPI